MDRAAQQLGGRRIVASVVIALAFLATWFHLAPNRNKLSVEDVIGGIEVAPELARHKELMYKPQLIQVVESVHVAVGYAISNTIFVEGNTGVIVIDTTESIAAAREILNEFRKVCGKPIQAIVYTHNHADHIQGTEVFIETPDSPPDIWAFHALMELNHRTRVVAQKSARGAIHQFGVRLGSQMIDVGIGPLLRTNVTNAHLYPVPNKLIYKEQETAQIAGLNVTFIHVPGETSDQIAVWLPELRVLLPADDIYKAFPNLYAIRGTPPRSSFEWLDSIRRMRSLKAEHLVPSHTLPVTGQKNIYELFTVYLHAIQYIHDQTVRHINQGLHMEEIAHRVRLPPSLTSHSYLQEFYGKASWSSKSVYESYLGWFSGDVVDLMPLTPNERASNIMKMVGRDELLQEAEKAINNGAMEEVQWAYELSSYVHRIDPDNDIASDLVLRALRTLAAAENNPLARNYYLTSALDDHRLINWKINANEVLHRSEMLWIFDLMKYRLKAELVTDVNLTLIFNFTDISEAYQLKIEYSVLDVEQIPCDDHQRFGDVKLTTISQVWRRILTKEVSPIVAYLLHGDLKIEGSLLTMRRFMSYFEREI